MVAISTDTRVVARQYEIEDRVTVQPIPEVDSVLDLWCPITPDTPYQRVLDVKVDSASQVSLGHDPDYGNLILYTRLQGPLSDEMCLHMRYRIERLVVTQRLDPEQVGSVASPAFFSRFLGPEQFVDVTPHTRELAQQIVGTEMNLLEQARRLYDYVVSYMAYDAQQQSWKGSTEHALACSVGNCNDIHALFLSLCRSIGIPARLVMGQALEAPQPGQEHCEVCGYHCWAEFFAPGLGWLPVDASCACKYGKHFLFGELELNHVAWSVGRDVLLYPAQRSERLLYFVSPYAELDGHMHRAVTRKLAFTEV